mmetsp:Transcript_21918/g.32475  ORF Transcript_21918/g.32475 Transcript_21918/m.32475 type:complete len:86 (-) Transcript_21918:23-280(-)
MHVLSSPYPVRHRVSRFSGGGGTSFPAEPSDTSWGAQKGAKRRHISSNNAKHDSSPDWGKQHDATSQADWHSKPSEESTPRQACI